MSMINRELIKELEEIQKRTICNCCGTGIKPNDRFCSYCGINLMYKTFGNVVFECQNCGAIFRHKPPKKHVCWKCLTKNSIKIQILEE